MAQQYKECLLPTPPRGILDIRNLFRYNSEDKVTEIKLAILSSNYTELYGIFIDRDKFQIKKNNVQVLV